MNEFQVTNQKWQVHITFDYHPWLLPLKLKDSCQSTISIPVRLTYAPRSAKTCHAALGVFPNPWAFTLRKIVKPRGISHPINMKEKSCAPSFRLSQFRFALQNFWVPGLSGAESLGGTREALEGWCSCFGSICKSFAPSISWKTCFKDRAKTPRSSICFYKKNQDHANPWRKNLSCPNCVCVCWYIDFLKIDLPHSFHGTIKSKLVQKNLRWYPQQHWAKIQPQRICVHYLALQSKAQAKRPHKVYQLISFVESLSQKQGANLAFKRQNTTPFLHSITACKKRGINPFPNKGTTCKKQRARFACNAKINTLQQPYARTLSRTGMSFVEPPFPTAKRRLCMPKENALCAFNSITCDNPFSEPCEQNVFPL